MKNLAIIGASGYIGGRLSYLLSEAGYNVTSVCFPSIPDDDKWASTVSNILVGDVRTKETIEVISEREFDVIIYLVSLDHQESNKDPYFVNSVNVMPVWNLLDSLKRKRKDVKFIYFSTIHVYGRLPNSIIDESFVPSPQSAYGLTHLMAENICRYYNKVSNIHCLIVRLSNSYGSPYFKDNNCWWLVVNDLCKTAFEKQRIELKSDGSPLRDFIHYLDIFQAIKILIDTKKLEKDTYNLSTKKTYSIYQLATKVQKVYNKRYNKQIPIILPDRVNLKIINNAYVIDNQRLLDLGFKPKVTAEEGINELFDYFENDKY